MSTDKPEEGLGPRTSSGEIPSENHVSKDYELLQTKLFTGAGLIVMLFGPLGVAWGVSSQTPLAEATGIPWALVLGLIVGGVGVAGLLIWAAIVIAHAMAEASNKSLPMAKAGLFAFVVLSGPLILIGVVGLVVTNLATGGTTVVRNPPQDRTTVGDVYEQLTWDAVDTIPLVEVPKTLGWEVPINDPAVPLGIASLTIRLAIVLFTISSISLIFKNARLVLRERDRTKVEKPNSSTG